MPTSTAIIASAFISTLGINTHIDFGSYGYQNLSVVENALNYLGVKNVRDSAQSSSDLQAWQQVAQATGVKFDDYMPEGSPASLRNAYSLISGLANTGILNFVEGGNEEDNSYAASQGTTLEYMVSFQRLVYVLGHSLNLPVINMSFGSGWTAANSWHGDYDKVGNLAGYVDYANAHTYPTGNNGQPNSDIKLLNADAQLAAVAVPVITTELGWDANTTSDTAIANYVLDGVLDGQQNGNVKTYIYALFDDGSGRFGMMNADGTPKAAGAALHNLTALMADSGTNAASFTPGSLSYHLGDAAGGEASVLMQKSDGSYWVWIWDETDGAHTVTLNLDSPAAQVQIFDPVVGTTALQTGTATAAVSLTLVDHPVAVEISPGTATAAGATGVTAAPPPTLSPLANVITSTATNGVIAADAGTVGIYATGTYNTITGGAATTTIQALAGSNTIHAGSGNVTINIASSNNNVYVGAGPATVGDSGSGNRITFGKPGGGATDIYGYILDQGDTLDFRLLLAGTQWTGDPNTIGNFLKSAPSGAADTAITVNPSGLSSGATYPVATLHGYSSTPLSVLLTHAITF